MPALATIRIRAPTGQARLSVDIPATTLPQFHSMSHPLTPTAQVASAINLPVGSFMIATDPGGKSTLASTAGLKHGDMVYIILSSEIAAVIDAQDSSKRRVVKQAPIDDLLEKTKGTIQRSRDPNFCRHGDSGMCDYCMPVEPYDPKYLEQNKIKHISFHAYLKHAIVANKTVSPEAANFIAPLDEPSHKLKVPCPGRTHDAYPKGLCSKCQPSAVTLTSQNFRMVDHVEFETPAIVEDFIKFWRSTGAQRFGLLYGRYETYTDKVPLGVKAVVCAIYEPPQENAPSFLQLQDPNPQQTTVNNIAGYLGLDLIGMIYTDLVDDGTGSGNVICKRHKDSYFLSSAEVVFSAHLQTQYPVACRYSSTGKFGSRFVTCVITGNEDGGIDISCFQISNTGAAMVRDGIIEASVDPGLVRVKSTTNDQYVPEVFYKFTNEYGIQVKEAAKPTFPVDYLLVTLSHGFPQNPNPTFKTTMGFPIENRNGATGDFQDMHAVHAHVSKGSAALSDFHLLVHIAELGFLERDDLAHVIRVAKNEDSFDSLAASSGWQTLVMVAMEAASDDVGGQTGAGAGASGSRDAGRVKVSRHWTCRHCTFNNLGGGDSCEVCGLPKDG
ncbi:nuclear protein localization protein 4 [Entophlyctis luteolus]|nr:nuclear protein localization protein 4 [Entophlyctis luteolus]